MDEKHILGIVGVIALTVYGSVALVCGMDGTITTAVVSAIVGIIGYVVGAVTTKKE